jgi:hypothetical protein
LEFSVFVTDFVELFRAAKGRRMAASAQGVAVEDSV